MSTFIYKTSIILVLHVCPDRILITLLGRSKYPLSADITARFAFPSCGFDFTLTINSFLPVFSTLSSLEPALTLTEILIYHLPVLASFAFGRSFMAFSELQTSSSESTSDLSCPLIYLS